MNKDEIAIWSDEILILTISHISKLIFENGFMLLFCVIWSLRQTSVSHDLCHMIGSHDNPSSESKAGPDLQLARAASTQTLIDLERKKIEWVHFLTVHMIIVTWQCHKKCHENVQCVKWAYICDMTLWHVNVANPWRKFRNIKIRAKMIDWPIKCLDCKNDW